MKLGKIIALAVNVKKATMKKTNDNAGVVCLTVWCSLAILVSVVGSIIENSNYIP